MVQGLETQAGTSASDALTTSQRAITVLETNDMGGFTVPTEGMYPYQWNWDSAFVALGFARFSPTRAIRELETLFEGQWATGMVPHIVFRTDDPRYFPGPAVWKTGQSPETSGITQPPVAASIALKLWRDFAETEHQVRLAALFPKLMASHRWFHTHRDPDDLGVVVMTHPWESGRDNSPEWDAPGNNIDTSRVEPYTRKDLDHADASMRPTKEQYDRFITLLQHGRDHQWDYRQIAKRGPFRVADVGMSFILQRADLDLRELATEIGGDALTCLPEINEWIERGRRGASLLWDEASRSFCSRDLITGQPSGYVTNASFLCFYAGVASDVQRDAMLAHWDRIAGKVKFMMPSFDPDQESFDPDRYWRGPVWAVVNFMIAQGLMKIGDNAKVQRITNDTRTLIDQMGFQEAYNPLSGRGSGGGKFSWTAAMWLAWVAPGSDYQET